jgi:hypothetical protein
MRRKGDTQRRPASRRTPLFFSLALLQSTGCSLLLMQRPPSGTLDPAPPIECTSSRDTVAVDGVLGWSLLTAGGLAATVSVGYPPVLLGGLAAALAGGILLLSSEYGSQAAVDCVEARARQAECASGLEAACRPPEATEPNAGQVDPRQDP